jgi:hypothetical protein
VNAAPNISFVVQALSCWLRTGSQCPIAGMGSSLWEVVGGKPISLETLLPKRKPHRKVGLCPRNRLYRLDRIWFNREIN